MQKIEDETLANKILDRVNSMNARMALITTVISVVYAAFPFKH